ncbi:hypothetical protein [Cytobacillus sp. IB215665]|uniref:hypothetical protein n=1 Tax=Cytobacillus sp. IB215665 TaxID=3097357 RepID=UPI002A0CEDF8|nr:hypothetical protein [Cytobacillus sp. IB215665]MDX8367203.1 hypothetical protein [Cytobacillus sp. IB215665]
MNFIETDIRRLLNMWRGKIRFKQNQSGIGQLEMIRKYKIVVNGEENEIMINRVILIMNSYEFLTVEGNKENIEVKAMVKPDSISKFEKFCDVLNELEQGNMVQAVA